MLFYSKMRSDLRDYLGVMAVYWEGSIGTKLFECPCDGGHSKRLSMLTINWSNDGKIPDLIVQVHFQKKQ